MLCKTTGGNFFKLCYLRQVCLFFSLWAVRSYENTLNLHESSQETCWAPSNAKGPECGTESKDSTHGARYAKAKQMRFWDSGKLGRIATNPNRSHVQAQELGVRVTLSSLQHQNVTVTASEMFLEFSFLS